MRLRTRLALVLLGVSLIPTLAVVPLALRAMRDAVARELEARIDAAEATAHAFAEERRLRVLRTLRELADSALVGEVVQSLELGDTGSLRDAGSRLLRQRELGVLALLDGRGVTVTSGHWPARINDPDPTLFAVTQQGAGPVWLEVELPTPDGPHRQLAFVAAARISQGENPLWAVGGPLASSAWAEELARLTGTRVELSAGGRSLGASGSVEPPHVSRRVSLGGDVEARLVFSRAGVLAAERQLTRSALVLSALGVCAALGLGFLLARRLTRPLEALTEASKRIAGGNLEARVEVKGPGELGQLEEAFNRMGADLRTATRRLVASERVAAWQEVARGLAHELKNPLTPIRMSLETLVAAHREQHPRFGEVFAQSAPAMLEEVERLRRIVDEFARFARLPPPVLSELELAAWAEQVLKVHGALPPSIELRRELTGPVQVMGDRDQLTQVLLNLVRNAEEAMEGKGTLTVRVFAEQEQALLEILDSGPGIPRELRARVLEPHFSTKSRGSGLGLAIAARICEEHGGSLEVDDAPGRGALLRMRLPLKKW